MEILPSHSLALPSDQGPHQREATKLAKRIRQAAEWLCYPMEQPVKLKYIGTRQQALAGKNSRSSATSTSRVMKSSGQHDLRFAVCVETGDYTTSLERWKIYRVIPDSDAERHDQIRVIDESGEDYLYPVEYFTPLQLPVTLSKLFHQHSTA